MPELPEVETVVRGLRKYLLNKKIIQINILSAKIRYPIPLDLKNKILNSTITNIGRRGKYILFYLDNNHIIILHLGMSGKILFSSDFMQNNKHDHFILGLNDKLILRYNDPRHFGFVDIMLNADLINYKPFIKMGPEPFSNDFNFNYIVKCIQKRSCNIKQFLINQEIIAGIGNIYACEIIFRLKINPGLCVKDLSKNSIEQLIAVTKYVLELAINFGGTTINNTYKHPDGKNGKFQNIALVYNRENKDCFDCDNKIIRMKQSGRSTYYCPWCQKINKLS